MSTVKTFDRSQMNPIKFLNNTAISVFNYHTLPVVSLPLRKKTKITCYCLSDKLFTGSEAEFKEFDPRFKFKPRFNYG